MGPAPLAPPAAHCRAGGPRLRLNSTRLEVGRLSVSGVSTLPADPSPLLDGFATVVCGLGCVAVGACAPSASAADAGAYNPTVVLVGEAPVVVVVVVEVAVRHSRCDRAWVAGPVGVSLTALPSTLGSADSAGVAASESGPKHSVAARRGAVDDVLGSWAVRRLVAERAHPTRPADQPRLRPSCRQPDRLRSPAPRRGTTTRRPATPVDCAPGRFRDRLRARTIPAAGSATAARHAAATSATRWWLPDLAAAAAASAIQVGAGHPIVDRLARQRTKAADDVVVLHNNYIVTPEPCGYVHRYTAHRSSWGSAEATAILGATSVPGWCDGDVVLARSSVTSATRRSGQPGGWADWALGGRRRRGDRRGTDGRACRNAHRVGRPAC